jgi:hypothetical protein
VWRTVLYEGHQIRPVAVPVADADDDARAARALIRVPTPGGAQDQPLRDLHDRTLVTEGYAVHIAMRWVDRHGA